MNIGQAIPIIDAIQLLETLVKSLEPTNEEEREFIESCWPTIEAAKETMRSLNKQKV